MMGLKFNRGRTFGFLLAACLAAGAAIQARASSCTINPSTPVPGRPMTVTYNPTGGPLDGEKTVHVQRGVNGWLQSDEVSMIRSKGLWILTGLCPERAESLNYSFHNGRGTQDDNGGSYWTFAVAAPAVVSSPPLAASASKAGVMMQGFYWDCPEGWYRTMAAKAAGLRDMQGGYGIDRIWFPPPQKSDSGVYSMGYDPYDYFDLGRYNQQGTIATHFGTQDDLKSTIATYRELGIVCMADIVLNHRSGGKKESNHNLNGEKTWTDFRSVKSRKCRWRYNQFHPSSFEWNDEAVFGGYPDVCHVTGNKKGSAGADLIEWGNWLADPDNAGFDGGWRFDYVKGVHPSYLADFRAGTGNAYGILECWDSIDIVDSYVKYSGNTPAFDFPAYFTLVDVFKNGGRISQLVDPDKVYAVGSPDTAVTFVANHDTDKDVDVESVTKNTMLAYAFILTYQGYPCIFWKDYFERGLATLGGQPGNGIKRLVWVRGALGGGQPRIQRLKTSSRDLLIYGTSTGSDTAPGYIVVINNNDSSTQSATVITANPSLRGKTLQCYAWYSYVDGQNAQPADVQCSGSGTVAVEAPPRGYAVYSVSPSLSDPWMTQDVGPVGLPGDAFSFGDTFTLTGSGRDIPGGADGFHYAYQPVSGDCTIQARVMSLENTDPKARAGVMIRQGTAADAMKAAVMVTPDKGIVFQCRNATGGGTGTVVKGGLSAPCWVRLVRSDNIFRGSYSRYGETWTPIGKSQTVNLSVGATAGLAVTSHNNGRLTTGVMDRVDFNAAPVAP